MSFLLVCQIVIAVLIAGAILLQPGESGFSSAGSFMAGGEHYHTRRGLEKVLFYSTFVLLVAFAVLSLLAMR